MIAAATDAEEAQARARRDRHLRTWTRGVETHGAFSGPTSEVHELLDALEPLRRQAFERGRVEGHASPRTPIATTRSSPSPAANAATQSSPPRAVRVDIRPLLTGKTEPGEVCEIPGVGPVPVSFARQVLSHGLLELVLHDGKDVHAIVTKTALRPRGAEDRDRGARPVLQGSGL